MTESLIHRICTSDNLPSLPTVAVEVLRLSRNADASIDDLVEVIQKDPALTGKILKTVNSALFGVSHKIGSLKQAVGLLGLRSVKVIALSFSLVDALKNSDDEHQLNFEMYWRRSLTTAAAARLLAKTIIPQMSEEAFVAGLLSDLGIIAAWRGAPDIYQKILNNWTSGNQRLVEIESQQMGFSHAHLNRELLHKWNLPENLCDVIGAHHGEGIENLSDGQTQKLAQVVHAASTIAELFCQEIPSSELDQVKADCCQETGISSEQLEKILEGLDQYVHEMSDMLSVKVGETTNYAQIQSEATTQLTQLAMMGEMDRLETQRQVKEAHEEINHLHDEKRAILEIASTDGLTKIANRAAFDKRLAEELDRARIESHPIGLIFMDLDHFKRFNNTYGHQTGDEVLRHVANCMNEVVQPVGFPARYGGEEFVVIVIRKTAEAIREMAEEIRKTIENRPLKQDNRELKITASLGAACIPSPTTSHTTRKLIEDADRCLYRAKFGGRNRVEM